MAGEGGAGSDRIAAAIAQLGEPPFAAALAADLFVGVGVDDLPGSAGDIACFVRSAAAALAERLPGRALVRVIDPAEALGREGPTLVELVNDNMPFLLDSVLGAIQAAGAEIRLVAHPIVTVERDAAGHLIAYHGRDRTPRPGALRESLMQIHLAPLALAEERDALAAGLQAVLRQVRLAVEGWRPILARLDELIAAYEAVPPPVDPEEMAEALAFLGWLKADNFIFLGLREYEAVGTAAAFQLRRRAVPGLGILADPDLRVLRRGQEVMTVTPEIRDFLMRPEPLVITKANVRSVVHRRVHMDYVGIKLYRPDGAIAGEVRIVGLFTSGAYTRSVRTVPYVRRKVDAVLARSGFDPDSHSGKALLNVLESYPRDELFQTDTDTLAEFALGILRLGERSRIRVFARRDKFDRFVSALVFVPRDHFNTDVRLRIGAYLADAFQGHVSASDSAFLEGGSARAHIIIGRWEGETPAPSQQQLEAAVAAIVRTWRDELAAALAARRDPAACKRLMERYAEGFPGSYRHDFGVAEAVFDIAVFERLGPTDPLAVHFYRRAEEGPDWTGLKLIHDGPIIALSVRVPMLENLGFHVVEERSYEIEPAGRSMLHVHHMTLRSISGRPVDLDRLGPSLETAFMAAWSGLAENDGYNALVLDAGLSWREVALIRTISRYLRQAGIAYSQDYMWATVGRHAGIAALIVRLFRDRLDPAAPGDGAATLAAIKGELEGVSSLDEDRILRRFVNIVAATLRTNFFQTAEDGGPKPVISVKLDPAVVEELPAPRPHREIFLSGPQVEGIHLRFGPIARGGIRWSDRPQDFRTEVLGLVKTQQVKNAVIVPVGAKGGFVPLRLPAGAGREAIGAEAKASYEVFIASLLDITDNLDAAEVVPPDTVVRRDGDDPYLVVAADKGTATYSDTANAISLGHRFWLGDAFASGGSAGYDHRAMGITARGAWEAVKRHFREIDRDIQSEPFTVVGVGDMSGDVFGNGMLLSRCTRLLAAFDHRDIFIDPDPDPARSFAERQRLAALPRSSWQDYDHAALSAGGGVFSRQVKAVPLSPEARAMLRLSSERPTPAEVMRAILAAQVDLLWFGGIGTYIRAASETAAEIGDRANDAIRLTAAEIGARVIGEGANLGVTARARIAFALRGGRINSDAIDNSAGVNTSDVEVNIKIALGAAVRAGRLDRPARDTLLAAMTDEVAARVLRNNTLQTLVLSVAERRGLEDFGHQQRLMQELGTRGLLDRAVEVLPDDAALAERFAAGRPLTRPELAILLAYAKIALNQEILASDLPDEPALAGELVDYFPPAMQRDYRDEILGHRLRREIVATRLANAVVNRGGPTLVTRVADRTGAAVADIVAAFLVVRAAFDIEGLNDAIDGLDGRIGGMLQLDLYRGVQDLLIAETIWFLANAAPVADLGKTTAEYRRAVDELAERAGKLPDSIAAEVAGAAAQYRQGGVPEALAGRLALLPVLRAATDIHLVATAAGTTTGVAATVYFGVGVHLRLHRIETMARAVPAGDYYQGLALDRTLQRLAEAQRRIATKALAAAAGAASLGLWLASHQAAVERVTQAVRAIIEGADPSLARVLVAAGLIADLARE